MRNEFNSFQIYIIKKTLFLLLLALAIAFITKRTDFVYGLMVGAAISILNLRLTALSIMKVSNETISKISPYLFSRCLIIYVICGVALFIAINKGMATFWGTFLGLLMVKIALFSEIILKCTNYHE